MTAPPDGLIELPRQRDCQTELGGLNVFHNTVAETHGQTKFRPIYFNGLRRLKKAPSPAARAKR